MKHFQGRVAAVILTLLGTSLSWGQTHHSVIHEADTGWVNDQLQAMTLDEKLGQLFMVAAYSNKDDKHIRRIDRLIKEENIGGLIFFQGTPQAQVGLNERWQAKSRLPLLVGQDAEWGLSMRLRNTFQFPWPLTVGATGDTALARRYGRAIGDHCSRIGVHLNFAPVVDINTNPDNPIINARSFGEDPERVTEMSRSYIKGLQGAGVLACAKHFPGHGDTDKDSHKTLPTVDHSLDHLKNVELYPYRELSKNKLASVMVAHLDVPALDASGKPTSLSKPTLDYLRSEIGFDGLVVTDALNMKGVSKQYAPGEVDLEALQAGNDLLLFSEDVAKAKSKIRQALRRGDISKEEIDTHVRRVLKAKSALGLAERKPVVQGPGLSQDLFREQDQILASELFAKATTVLINRDKTIPVKNLRDKKFAVVTAGKDVGNTFPETLKNFAQVDHYDFDPNFKSRLLATLSDYDLVIFGLYTANDNPWQSYAIGSEIREFIDQVSLQNRMIIDVFANPYSLKNLDEARLAHGLIMSYQNDPAAEREAAEIIFGAQGARGKLPVTAGKRFPEGFGLETSSLGRMGYGFPGEVGLDEHKLLQINDIMQEAITKRATPGGQILVARHGKVVFHQAYGYHTYEAVRRTKFEHVYDLASITKIAATVPILMRLVEEGKMDLDKTLSEYLPEARGTNKEDLVIRDILAHQARLKPWIPFYKSTLDKDRHFSSDYYSRQRSFNYPLQVAFGIYAERHMRDTLLQRVLESPLRKRKEYKYSDLGYYLLLEVIESITGQRLEVLAHQFLYHSMGAYTMGFYPRQLFLPEQIVPTEKDNYFRKQLIHGYVHDQGAALLGGVAGHAGLFSNANDLAKLMHMYMQKGSYGGIRYFDSVTVNEFIRCQFCESENRRGIGFDKPQLEGPGPTCGCLSRKSFGHSGFTGTLAWADPEEEIVYVFLSNRVHPDASNRKLISLDTRTRIQKVIYEAIERNSDSTFLSHHQSALNEGPAQ